MSFAHIGNKKEVHLTHPAHPILFPPSWPMATQALFTPPPTPPLKGAGGTSEGGTPPIVGAGGTSEGGTPPIVGAGGSTKRGRESVESGYAKQLHQSL